MDGEADDLAIGASCTASYTFTPSSATNDASTGFKESSLVFLSFFLVLIACNYFQLLLFVIAYY